MSFPRRDLPVWVLLKLGLCFGCQFLDLGRYQGNIYLMTGRYIPHFDLNSLTFLLSFGDPIRDPIRDPVRSDPDFVDAASSTRIFSGLYC